MINNKNVTIMVKWGFENKFPFKFEIMKGVVYEVKNKKHTYSYNYSWNIV